MGRLFRKGAGWMKKKNHYDEGKPSIRLGKGRRIEGKRGSFKTHPH